MRGVSSGGVDDEEDGRTGEVSLPHYALHQGGQSSEGSNDVKTWIKRLKLGRVKLNLQFTAEVMPTPKQIAHSQLLDVPGEDIRIDAYGGRWELCQDSVTRCFVWLHKNCDVVSENGKCIACGAQAPTF